MISIQMIKLMQYYKVIIQNLLKDNQKEWLKQDKKHLNLQDKHNVIIVMHNMYFGKYQMHVVEYKNISE